MGKKITKQDCDAVDGVFKYNNVCIVKDEECKRDGDKVSCKFWGKDGDRDVTFESSMNIRVVSQLLNPIHEHKNPNLVHSLVVEAPTEFDITFWEFKDMYFQDIQTRAKPVRGRLKVAKRKLNKKDISDEAVVVIRNIGKAMDVFGLKHTNHMTGLKYIDEDVFVTEGECPACGGRATYKHYGSFQYMPSKECGCCGWTGNIELYDSDFEPVEVQITKSVEKELKETGVMDAYFGTGDVYEAVFEAGYDPNEFIKRLQELAKNDIEACGVVA